MEGYGKYFWHTLADTADENFMVGGLGPILFHQDSRFYTLGHGGFRKRSWYAVTRVLVTRTDNGNKMFNFSEIVGSGAAAGSPPFTILRSIRHGLRSVRSGSPATSSTASTSGGKSGGPPRTNTSSTPTRNRQDYGGVSDTLVRTPMPNLKIVYLELLRITYPQLKPSTPIYSAGPSRTTVPPTPPSPTAAPKGASTQTQRNAQRLPCQSSSPTSGTDRAGHSESRRKITLPIFSFPGGRRFHFADPAGNELAAMQRE